MDISITSVVIFLIFFIFVSFGSGVGKNCCKVNMVFAICTCVDDWLAICNYHVKMVQINDLCSCVSVIWVEEIFMWSTSVNTNVNGPVLTIYAVSIYVDIYIHIWGVPRLKSASTYRFFQYLFK